MPAYILEVTTGDIGCSADSSGHFKLILQSSKAIETFKFFIWIVGYKKKEIEAKAGQFLIIELELEPVRTQEVVVTADSVVSESTSLLRMTILELFPTIKLELSPGHYCQLKVL
ncbi:MAG: hypothetical protein N3B16_04115 [Candidatus Aminicenantes bacterium]|nr:hypothetical protein [Candidatus Aminicenantes bacterium]